MRFTLPIKKCRVEGVFLVSVCLPLFLFMVNVVRGGEIPLAMNEAAWEKRVFLEAAWKVDEKDAVQLALVSDPLMGPALSIGPWRAGKWSTRFDAKEKVSQTRGTIRGFYKTEGLLPYQAQVSALFFKGEKKLNSRSMSLAPATNWTAFEFPVRLAHPLADSLRIGLGLADKTEGRVLFVRLSFSTEVGPLEKSGTPVPTVTRPVPAVPAAPGKYYRLQEQAGTWWLINPKGKAFYSVATDAAGLPRSESGIERGREMIGTLQRAGFNSFGGWSSVASWAPVMEKLSAEGKTPPPLFRSLQAGTMKAEFHCLAGPGESTKAVEHGFPDPFDPRFAEALRQQVRETVKLVGGKVWFAGWFADNEMAFRDLQERVYSPHCAAALRKFLETRYQNDIQRLNAAWQTSFKSYDDLIQSQPRPVLRQGRLYEDFRAFRREIVKRHVELTLSILREEDPGRLVFSQRFMMNSFSDWVDLLDLFRAYDGIGINMYPENITAGLSANEKALLNLVHEKTGKPLIITEWSIPAIDSRLYDNPAKLDWSWGDTVETQRQRASQAARVALDQYNLPFVVGAHWFTLRDVDSDKRQANRGLLKASGLPWPELMQSLRDVHNKFAGREP